MQVDVIDWSNKCTAQCEIFKEREIFRVIIVLYYIVNSNWKTLYCLTDMKNFEVTNFSFSW